MKYYRLILLILIIPFINCNKAEKDIQVDTENSAIEKIDKSDIDENIEYNKLTENEKIVIGFYGDEFPIPSFICGFIFLPNKIFAYWDYRTKENINKQYDGCIGIWKIENDILFILKKTDFYWEKPYEKQANGTFPGKDNRIIENKVITEEWFKISNLSTYEDWKESTYNDEEIIVPPNLKINPIVAGKKLDKSKSYFKLIDYNVIINGNIPEINKYNYNNYSNIIQIISF